MKPPTTTAAAVQLEILNLLPPPYTPCLSLK